MVDWKTGEPPDTAEARATPRSSSAVYRLAWAALTRVCPAIGAGGVPLRAHGRTVMPEVLPGADDLAALLARPGPG